MNRRTVATVCLPLLPRLPLRLQHHSSSPLLVAISVQFIADFLLSKIQSFCLGPTPHFYEVVSIRNLRRPKRVYWRMGTRPPPLARPPADQCGQGVVEEERCGKGATSVVKRKAMIVIVFGSLV